MHCCGGGGGEFVDADGREERAMRNGFRVSLRPTTCGCQCPTEWELIRLFPTATAVGTALRVRQTKRQLHTQTPPMPAVVLLLVAPDAAVDAEVCLLLPSPSSPQSTT